MMGDHSTVVSAPVTIVGLGSLLSERSSRTTFPNLENFRLGRVHGYRRVFAHSAAIFVERGIADGQHAPIPLQTEGPTGPV